jgi:hypothetical protein
MAAALEPDAQRIGLGLTASGAFVSNMVGF